MSKIAYPFQEQAIQVGLDLNIFVHDECGCGKKITMLEIARRLREVYKLPTLVVTVKRDILQWKREIYGQDSNIPIVTGMVGAPLWVPEVSDWWMILHYEALVNHIKGLSRVKFGTVILDEGHHIKNWQAQRTKAAKRLQALRKIVGTGTPMDKSPVDLWSQLEFINPEKYRGTRRAFCERHERAFIDLAGYRRVLPGVKSATLLSQELAPFTFARTKKDVAPDLPPNIEKVVHIELTGAQATLYRRIQHANDIIVTDESLTDSIMIGTVLAQMVREQQAALDPSLLGSNAEAAKLEWLRDWREGNPNEPTIIFTNYRAVAQQLARTYDAHLIMGGVALPDRWTKKTIVATIRAGGAALDLGFMTTTIFLDENHSQLAMTQAINRTDRLNKVGPSETIYLVAANTIDTVIHASWRAKWSRTQLLKAYIAWRQGAPHPLASPTTS